LVNKEAELNNRIDQVEASATGTAWGFVEASTTESAGTFFADIKSASETGFTALDGSGFAGSTTTRFDFTSSDALVNRLFKPVGMTHINVMAELNYTGEGGGAFGTDGTVGIELGVAADVGTSTASVTSTSPEEFARVKTIDSAVLPSPSVVEQYTVSIPISLLDLENDTIFNIKTRVKIVGSNFVDVGGGAGGDPLPLLEFGKIRIITSSYSVAGRILGEDGTSTSLAAVVSASDIGAV